MGVSFLSSMITTFELASAANMSSLPLLGGVTSEHDVLLAQKYGLKNLKIFPATVVRPNMVQSLLENTKRSETVASEDRCSYIIAGGLTPSDMAPYLAAGVDGFAFGIDCGSGDADIISNQLRNVLEPYRSL